MTAPINQYLKEITAIAAAGATEFSFRTPLENLLKACAPPGFQILQEPSRITGAGAPDFRISAKGGGIVGYMECKKPGANLQKLLPSAQIKKGHDNLRAGKNV